MKEIVQIFRIVKGFTKSELSVLKGRKVEEFYKG